MQAWQPRQAGTENLSQTASSCWTGHSVSTGLLTLPGRSWLLAVQHWESQRQNSTFWAGGRTSQTPMFGSNEHSSRNFSFSSCQSSVVAMTSAQSWGRRRVSARTKSFLEKRGVDREAIKKH